MGNGPRYPKGFDITLADVVSYYNLTEDQVRELGNMTANREIANAVVGGNMYYRKATIERLFVDGSSDGRE